MTSSRQEGLRAEWGLQALSRQVLRFALLIGVLALHASSVQAQGIADRSRPDDAEEQAKPYRVIGELAYRRLGILDKTPSNDQYSLVTANASYGFDIPYTDKPLYAFAKVGALQRYSAEPNESGATLRDFQLGAEYAWRLPTKLDIGLLHRASFFVPTSRASQVQDLVLAPELLTRGQWAWGPLGVGAELMGQFRWHSYAERAGTNATMNTKYVLRSRLFATYMPIKDETYGAAMLGAFTGSRWSFRYSSRDTHESDVSEAAPVFQNYEWGIFAAYVPRPWLTLTIDLSQEGSVLRDGVVNTFLTHRDETELGFTATFAL